MSKNLFSLLVNGLLGAGGSGGGQEGAGAATRSVEVDGSSYSYQVYVPARLQAKRDAPVILFLHGINQRGEGGFLPTSGASAALVRHQLERVGAVILLPQCRRNHYWSDSAMDRMVMGALDQTIAEFGADARRLYVTGVSMGGYGAWHLASAHPGLFAAIVSICGGSPLRNGDRFGPIASGVGRTPAWVFHGANDPVVPVEESRQMVEALKSNGGDVRYSEYPGVGHNVWMKVLSEKGLLPWLLSQRLPV